MPRGRKVLVECGLDHRYNRFACGECIFADPHEAPEFTELLQEIKQRGGLMIHARALSSS